MKVTIEGDLAQVKDAMYFQAAETPKRIARKRNEEARKVFMERRRIVVAAFKKVRYAATSSEDTARLLAAIRRTKGVTDGDLQLAQEILSRPFDGNDQ